MNSGLSSPIVSDTNSANDNTKSWSKKKNVLFATVASLVGGQVAMSAYVEKNNSSTMPFSTQSADTILAKSSTTTSIPAAEKAAASDEGIPSWEMWDRNSILPPSTEGNECRWTTYEVGGNTVPFCVHKQKDIISDHIIDKGHLGHCLQLFKLWEEAVASSMADVNTKNNVRRRERDLFFVDIGANIGSCVVTVLLSTPPSVKIVAFEPVPDNQFCLTSTLMAMPAEMRERVFFYPIALGSGRSHGNAPSKAYMFSQGDNMGNSVVHKMPKEEGRRDYRGPFEVVVEPLDQVVKLHHQNSGNEFSNIPVVKVDGMGFECEILKGMRSLLPFVEAMTLDVYSDKVIHQEQFGCDSMFIFKFLKDNGFRIYINGKEVNAPLPGREGYEINAKKW